MAEKIIVKNTVSHKYRSYAISTESDSIREIVHLESQAKQLVETLDTQSTDFNFFSNYHTLRQGLLMLNLPILNFYHNRYHHSTYEEPFIKAWVKDIALQTFFESASILQAKNAPMMRRALQEINMETLTDSLKHSQSLYDVPKYVTNFLSVLVEDSA